ncbi:MAG TPA: ParB/RepB/Spo0J family partition protein [Bacteroidales bacterium]|nr:ParB/RepB/Spo0J family partition protein [Bacteroidales bacterium]
MNTRKNALGRGLGALLEGANDESAQGVSAPVIAFPMIDIDEIEANPYQPRDRFEQEALKGLSESIKHQGLIQPITVRKLKNGKYQLISGERRLRASKMAGLTQIPAFIREADDEAVLQMALVENIQRENLNAIEVALTFDKLMDEYKMTQEMLSEKVGKKRTTVANYLRLLKLPIEIQAGIRDNKITMGHARSLVGLEDEAKMRIVFDRIIAEDLSVRQVEDIVRGMVAVPEKKTAKKKEKDLAHEELQKSIAAKTGLKVQVKSGLKGGTLTIHFKNEEDLKKIETIFH